MPVERILFLGQKPVGETAWNRIRERGDAEYEIGGIVTNKSAEAVWWDSSRIAESAGELPVIDNESRNTEKILELIENQGIDFLLSVHHPWILESSILEAVGYRAINFHNAMLPRYKGYNPVNHAILNGDSDFGSTVHWMSDEVDEGDAIYQATFPIAPDETALSLYSKENVAAIILLDRVLDDICAGNELPSRPLSDGGTFHSRASIEGLNEIERVESSELDRKSRAFFFPPFEPAYVQQSSNQHQILPSGAYDLLAAFGDDVRSLHEHVRNVVDPELEIV